MELKDNSAPLFFSYSEFKLSLMDDPDEALELNLKPEKLDSESYEIKLQKARILKRLKKYEEADKIFDEVMANLDSLKNKIKRITIDQSADNFKRWGEKYLLQENIPEAVAMYTKALNRIEMLDEIEMDSRVIITLSKILKSIQYTCVFLGIEYEPGTNLYITVFFKNSDLKFVKVQSTKT